MLVKVQKGDTLASLASRHDVSPNNIAAWNKLKIPVALKPGQSIAILVPTTSSSKGSKTAGKKSNTQQGAKATSGAHTAGKSKTKATAKINKKINN
jgi:membrane-bound lytic murein transglycosylase D